MKYFYYYDKAVVTLVKYYYYYDKSVVTLVKNYSYCLLTRELFSSVANWTVESGGFGTETLCSKRASRGASGLTTCLIRDGQGARGAGGGLVPLL